MAQIKARGVFGFWKRLGWQIPAIGVALLTAYLLWQRTQPERLPDSVQVGGSIVDGNLYWIAYRDPLLRLDGSIRSQSIHGGGERTIVAAEPGYEFYPPSYDSTYPFRIVDGALYYAVHARPPQIANVGGGGGGSYVQLLGTFLLPTPPPSTSEPGVKRVRIPPVHFSSGDIHFREVSLRGGHPQEKAVLNGSDFCLVGSHVFWIRRGPDEVVSVTRGSRTREMQTWWEVKGHSDLMLTSLTDGTTRRIRAGISYLMSYAAGDAGLLFTEPAPFPNSPTLSYARASDGSVRSIGTLQAGHPVTSLEFGGRLYWIISIQNPFPLSDMHHVLMSANLDGSDRREIVTSMEKKSVGNIALYPYKGSLYCCLDQLTTDYNGHPKPFLCRLHPERADPLEIVRKLPTGAEGRSWQFDGGFLYFAWSVPNRSLWSALMESDVRPAYASSFRRVPVDP